jgi:hypothetical protein
MATLIELNSLNGLQDELLPEKTRPPNQTLSPNALHRTALSAKKPSMSISAPSISTMMVVSARMRLSHSPSD